MLNPSLTIKSPDSGILDRARISASRTNRALRLRRKMIAPTIIIRRTATATTAMITVLLPSPTCGSPVPLSVKTSVGHF